MELTAYANGATKTIELGAHQTVVSRLLYRGQILRDQMLKKFYDPDAGDDPMNRARWNFFCLSTQTVADPPCELAHPSDGEDEFNRKLDALLSLDNELVERWVVAINEMNMPLVAREQLPSELLTTEEKKAKSSSARGQK